MLMAGKSITSVDDPLVRITPDYLYQKIKNSPADLSSRIRQLRQVRSLDIKRYSALKRTLPYVVCGIFSPPLRKTENFAWITHFILDIDHLSSKGMTIEGVKAKVSGCDQVIMAFTSPGEDGLKLLFRLSEKCHDSGKFSLFYKLFARWFSLQYGFDQVIDFRTSDVTRACFLSEDPEIFYYPDAKPVEMHFFVDFNNPAQIRDFQLEMKEEEVKLAKAEKENISSVEELAKGPREPESEVLKEIRSLLNPNVRTKREKQIFIPEEMEKIVQTVIDHFLSRGITTTEVINIHYGKKFRFLLATRQAEINVFYGKRGFSVVQTPRNGTDKELNEITWKMLCEMLL